MGESCQWPDGRKPKRKKEEVSRQEKSNSTTSISTQPQQQQQRHPSTAATALFAATRGICQPQPSDSQSPSFWDALPLSGAAHHQNQNANATPTNPAISSFPTFPSSWLGVSSSTNDETPNFDFLSCLERPHVAYVNDDSSNEEGLELYYYRLYVSLCCIHFLLLNCLTNL